MSATIALPTTGSTMPDVALTTTSGDPVRLAEVVAGSRSVVFFMRSSGCAICLGHVATLVKMVQGGELEGVRVIIITPGDASDAAKVATRVPAGVATVYASGIDHSAVGLGTFLTIQHSGTFVLAADGTVLTVRTATIPTGSFSRDEVLAALA